MTLTLMDRNGRSTIASAEAQAALAAGDTVRAREKFAEAASFLEQDITNTRKQSEKHLLRFLAATQYFKGGDYMKALNLSQKIEQRLLPENVRHLFPTFMKDVRSRTSLHYEQQVRQNLRNAFDKKDHTRILELLQEHPYLYAPDQLAFLRAASCEKLKNYRAAAIFYGEAIRLNPNEANLVFDAAALPLTLPGQGKLEEAWEYARYQLEMLQHPVTILVASIVCFHKASTALKDEHRQIYSQEQVEYFDRFRASYGSLSPIHQTHPAMRDLMMLGFQATAMSLIRLKDETRALQVSNEAIAFDQTLPDFWTLRGVVQFPQPVSFGDFQKAIKLGDDSSLPYSCLAYGALTDGDYPSALYLVQQALKRKPAPHSASQFYAWMAICRGKMGAKREEVEGLFLQALQNDPSNKTVESYHRLFLNSPETWIDLTKPDLAQDQVREEAVRAVLTHNPRVPRPPDQADSLVPGFGVNGASKA